MNLKRRFCTIRSKLTLALGAIGVVLLISSIISVMSYERMSNYVSGMIARDIRNIYTAQQISDMCSDFNLRILTVIGDESDNSVPDFDFNTFSDGCDEIRDALSSDGNLPLADSVEYAYAAYMLTAAELPQVLRSDFVNSREWYFDRLQPRYNTLKDYIDRLNNMIYDGLSRNSKTFDRGFYRSIIPGIVAVGVGLLLILMLLFYMLSYYVRPLEKMRTALSAYRSVDKRYSVTFEGDDELSDINSSITELSEENFQLRKRILKKYESKDDK